MAKFIGVDVGGTKIAAAVVDSETGTVIGRIVAPTDVHLGQDSVLKRIIQVIAALPSKAGLTPAEIDGLGVGVPGSVDMVHGRTLFWATAASQWRDVPLTDVLVQHTGYRSWLINDACAFTLAEVVWGAGRGARCVVGLTLGTGIGGGIAIDGQISFGLHGTAGEIGHQIVDPNGPPCACGNWGCLEVFACGPAIVAQGTRAVLLGQSPLLDKLIEHDIRRITPETIMRAAQEGDKSAQDILTRTGVWLGIGVANLIHILAPERIVIGGGVAQLGDWLFTPLRETVKQRCHVIPAEGVCIVEAACGSDAGIIGAAMWASQQK